MLIYGFHAIIARIKTHSHTINQVWLNENRRDKRMQQTIDLLTHYKVKYSLVNIDTLNKKTSESHQGIIADIEAVKLENNLDIIIDNLEANNQKANFLILDGVTDPHNLGACFRNADAFGVHAIIAPINNSVKINALVAKVASGACESIPYILVTNLGRTINELKERGIWIIGTSDKSDYSLYDEKLDLNNHIAWVMGAEGSGMRKGIMDKCDFLVSIPMAGVVSSLNISVASGVCLSETARRRI